MGKGDNFHCITVLKSDIFGSIERGFLNTEDGKKFEAIKRVYSPNRLLRPLTRLLAKNEIKALKKLQDTSPSPYFPTLLSVDKKSHIRSYIQGQSIYKSPNALTNDYFQECKKLLQHLYDAGICNNDLAKEANWLINEENGRPAITDFQLALCFKNKKSRLFIQLALDDIRHLLKHKRKYSFLTAEEQSQLNHRSLVNRIWMKTGKKLHKFITRKLLGWQERNGPEERNI